MSRTRRAGGVVLGAMCASIIAMTAAQAASLRDTLVDAYNNSQLLEQSRFLLRVQDEGALQEIITLLPTLNFISNLTRDLEADTTTSTVSLVADWSLFEGGGRLAAIEAAENTVEATRQQLVVLEQQVLLDAVTAYMSVWQDTQVVRVSERNVRVIEEQLRAAQDRFEVGEDTRTDVAEAQAALALAESNLAGVRGALDISRELFAIAVGEYPGNLTGPGPLPTLPASQDEAERLARQVHPSILAIQFEVSAAESLVEEARSAGRPSLSIRLSGTETLDSPFPNGEGFDSSVSLDFTQPIYLGGQIASLERGALAQVSATRFSLNQQVLINLQAVGNAYANLQIANAQIRANDERANAAQLAFEGVREEAALGARTTLDVLDAEQNVLEAQVERIEAQADLYIAAYSVLLASGLLTADLLELPVERYDVDAYPNAFPAGVPRAFSPQGERLDSLLERLGRD